MNQIIKEGDQGNIIAITMEEGIAHVFSISAHKTLLKAKVEKSITKNKGAASGIKHGVSKNKFFDNVISALEQNFTGDNAQYFEKVSCVVVGSPGFTKENFYNYLKDIVTKKASKFVQDVFGLLVTAHCSSGFKHSLSEILGNEEVQRRI